jgi:hypothetical protein
MDPFAVTAAVRVDPAAAVHLALDAKRAWSVADGPTFTGTLLVVLQRPGEPADDFAVREEE